jgi:hypothetical protein
MKAPPRFAALAVACLVLLVSCPAEEVSAFHWYDSGGRTLAFSREGLFAKETPGVLSGTSRLAVLRLRKPYIMSETGTLGVGLSRTLGGSARLRFEILPSASSDKPLPAWELSLPDAHTRVALTLGAGQAISALRISLVGTDASLLPEVLLEGLAFEGSWRGFERLDGLTRLSPDFSMYAAGAVLVSTLALPFGEAGSAATASSVPALRLAWGPGTEASVLELLGDGGRTFRIAQGLDEGEVLIPEAAFPRTPTRLELRTPARLRIDRFAAESVPSGEADLLDLGVILSLPRGALLPAGEDPGDFDAYRWNRRPEVIVLDFSDYAAQDRALKRLAFFVEKLGFKGRLASDAEIAGLHGWNAHDYQAADLARFFERARATSFQLGASEIALRDLLVGRGVLRREGGGYAPGRGALISVSRESPSWLRGTFITHESSHALYFTDPDFAAFVKRTWAAVGREERWFWLLYFGWMNYDTTNQDLMANEFMAYLFQQPVAKVGEYFTKTLPPRVLENHPELQERIDAWMLEWGGSFTAHALEIEAWLRDRYGLAGGRSWFVW